MTFKVLNESFLLCFSLRTASSNAVTNTTTTGTSRTAPSAAGAERCSCAGTTTAVGKIGERRGGEERERVCKCQSGGVDMWRIESKWEIETD